jgi:hypothetical protein
MSADNLLKVVRCLYLAKSLPMNLTIAKFHFQTFVPWMIFSTLLWYNILYKRVTFSLNEANSRHRILLKSNQTMSFNTCMISDVKLLRSQYSRWKALGIYFILGFNPKHGSIRSSIFALTLKLLITCDGLAINLKLIWCFSRPSPWLTHQWSLKKP